MKRSAHRLAAICSLVLALAASLLVAAPALAEGAAHTRVVSAVPGTNSPQVVDGRVFAITQVGNTAVIGGSFTQVQPQNRSATYTMNYIAAFDATTGALNTAFLPQLDGQVESLAPGPTAGTVYAGGYFNNAAGVRSKGVVLLNLTNGSRVTSFKPAAMNGSVRSLRMVGSRLYIGGTFTTLGGVAHGGVGALNASTGAVDPFVSSSVTENHNWTEGSTGVAKAAVGVFALDVTPDGKQLAIIGNFRKVDGLDRRQVALFDLTGTTAVVRPDWRARGYEAACYSFAYDTYMRDIDFAPDGASFAIATTGGGNAALCDTAARFETAATGDDVRPTWASYAGGDSLLSVAMTGAAVYTGGHQRWMNNPLGNDFAGPGAVPRPGIAGLDVKNGVPLAWNPGRNPRGAGAYSLYATPAGLWVGSDTDWVGDSYNYRRQKIAFFPLGTAAHTDQVKALPAGVFLGAEQQTSTNVLYRVNAGGGDLASTDSGPDWVADVDSSSPYRNSGSNAAGWDPVASVDDTVPAGTPKAVFDSERWDPGSKNDGGEMSWSFPVASGTEVEVRVYLANRCGCTSAAGSRVFDVAVEGTTRLDDFDIVAATGDQRGTMRSWTVTSDGSIELDFGHEVENSLVNAIEIVRTGAVAPSTTSNLVRRDFTGTSAGPAELVSSSVDWATLRGATLVGSSLFYGKTTDSNLYRRSFDGATLGAEVLVDPYNDPRWSERDTGSGQTYRGTKPGFYAEIPGLTSMFYDGAGRLYYTLSGSSGLFHRAFSPDSGIIHPQRQQVQGASLPAVSGAFLSDGQLYYVARATGQMVRVGFDGTTFTSTPTVVSGPGVDGVDWRAKVLFVGPESAPNTRPVASSTVSCTNLTCTFDGRASSDPDGSIRSYAWTFGDGATSSASNGTHTYTANGTYPVTLTVTDDRGATHSVTRTVTVAARVNGAPTAAFEASCTPGACSFDASGSRDDGTIASWAWDFGDGTTSSTGPGVSHEYAAPGSYTVTLVVTDNEGATGTSTKTVQVPAQPSSAVAFRGASSYAGNTARAVVTVPAATQAGDALVLTVSSGTATAHTPPAGWTEVTRVQGAALTTVWQKVATTSDAGKTVNVELSGMSGTLTKTTAQLLAYSGTKAASPVTAVAAADAVTTTRHVAPAASVPAGSRVVRYFSDKSSSTTLWTPPSGLTVRVLEYGSGSGRVSALVGEEVAVAGGGSVPASTATTDTATRGTAVTIVLAPAG